MRAIAAQHYAADDLTKRKSVVGPCNHHTTIVKN